MLRPVNPYIAGSPLRNEKGFFGRQEALKWVSSELCNSNTNALVFGGPRRIGKTSLLLQLERILPGNNFFPIYLSLQGNAARPFSHVLIEWANKIVRRLQLQLPNPDSFDDRGEFFQNLFLPIIYHALDTNCRPVLLLDEFDVMDQAVKEDLPENATAKVIYTFLHRVMIEDPRLAFIFTMGRQAEDLSLDSAAILKASLHRDIWLLDQKSAELLVRNAEENGTLHFSKDAVDGILKLTSGHPYLTQLLCQRIWERAYESVSMKLPEIDLTNVKSAIPDALEAGQQVFIWIWNELTPAEKIYTSALAEAVEQENEIISEDHLIRVLTTYASKLRTREIELAQQDLVKRWVLRESEDGYCFAVELIRRWVRNHRPLQGVKEELDQFNPLANKYYELGQQVFRLGQLEAAASNFQHALETNPNHRKARCTLGEVLLRLGRVTDAVIELEHAYEDDSDARFPLVRALVAQAEVKEQNGDNDEALATCARILDLSPNEHIAREIINRVWVKQGSAAMEQGDLEKALAAYQQAGAKDWEDAVDLVRRSLDEDLTLFHSMFYLGEILLDLGRTETALAEVNAIITTYQQACPERQQEMIVFFRSILTQRSDCTLARLLLGQLILMNNQPNEALSELKRAYEEDKSNNKALIIYILLARAEAAHVSRKWLMALEDCAKILQIDPEQKLALEIMNETISQVKEVEGDAIPDKQFTEERLTHRHLDAKSTFGIDRNQLSELACTAKNQIRLLGVIALNADWRSFAQKWANIIRNKTTFEITILCESDNTLFSKSLTYDTDASENQHSFQELKFIRDRALIDFPDMLSDEGIPCFGNKQITIEITHLPIPVSIVQIDGRIFANLWLHNIGECFEEIDPIHPWHSQIQRYLYTYFEPLLGRKYASLPNTELLEIFDYENIPRGIYPRNSFYDTDYFQRVVWVFIFDRQGRLLIHRRADNAKDNQGMWDKSVGGHVEFSEFNTSNSAYREVIEELFTPESEKIKSDFKKWKISDEEVIYLGEWRPNQRKLHPFSEIRSFKREWSFFRFQNSERFYSPRTLPDGKIRRLKVIPDIFLFVAGPQLTDKLLDELKNSTFKLIELSELKNAVNRALSKKEVPDFDRNKLGKGRLIPRFSPDLINIMTGKLYSTLTEFEQHIKRYLKEELTSK